MVVKWHDNRDVIVASNCYSVKSGKSQQETVQRYCKEKKEGVNLKQSHLINRYSKSMGGTDRMNQNINNKQISIRGKKWYFGIFT